MTKKSFGVISLGLGMALLGLNIADGAEASLIGVFGSILLIMMGIWDFIEHYADARAQIEANEIIRQDRKNRKNIRD